MIERLTRSEEEWRRILPPDRYLILRQKGTEPAFRNPYNEHWEAGVYKCFACGLPLFSSAAKFHSGSGWPSFFRPLSSDVAETHADHSFGMTRTEVVCARCGSHLGHVFKDGPRAAGGLRYCINSASLRFIGLDDLEARGYGDYRRLFTTAESKGDDVTDTKTAILAGGCFWGMQDLIRKQPGVVSTRVGYTGGQNDHPTYRNHPGHAEAIEISYDPARTSFRDLLEFFFQIHDPSTKDRQGNDVGTSYRSAIFYLDDDQKRVALDTIADVDASGLWPGKVVTEVTPASGFWDAEPEHQDYLERFPNGYTCHYPRPGWKLPKRQTA